MRFIVLFLIVLSVSCGPEENQTPIIVLDASKDAQDIGSPDVGADALPDLTPIVEYESTVVTQNEGERLSATFVDDQVVLAWVEPDSEGATLGTVALAIYDGDVNTKTVDVGRTNHSGGGPRPDRFWTDVGSHGSSIVLTYHDYYRDQDGNSGSHVYALIYDQELRPLMRKTQLNAEFPDENILGAEPVAAYTPRISSRNGDLLVFWTDYRFNEPKVLGQNFVVHGVYYTTFDESGIIDEDVQLLQGSPGSPASGTRITNGDNASTWAWYKETTDERKIIVADINKPDESTSIAVDNRFAKIAVSNAGIFWSYGDSPDVIAFATKEQETGRQLKTTTGSIEQLRFYGDVLVALETNVDETETKILGWKFVDGELVDAFKPQDVTGALKLLNGRNQNGSVELLLSEQENDTATITRHRFSLIQ